MRPSPLVLAVLAASPVVAGAPQRGMPPLTAQTQRSGGPVDPARAALRFLHADLSFEVTPRTRRLDGTAVLRFTAGTPLATLVLDLDRNLAVSGVTVDDMPLPRGTWRNPDGRLSIALPRPIDAGMTFSVRIIYGGTPHVARNAPWDDGIVWATTPDGRPWIATTSEGYGCDLLWPCLDFPTGEPSSVDLHIVAPKGLAAPANGVLVRIEPLPDGRTRWHWRARQPNTYAIALNIGPYERLAGMHRSRFGNTIPLEYWHLPRRAAEARALFDEFAPTLDFFERTIGPYPFGDEKLGVVQTPHKGMEHQTINAYGNDYAKAPEGFDWLFQHELAHEWFGNQATAADWDDYWLHEGFANYMQPLYGRWREGEARYAVMMEQQRNAILNRVPLVSGRSRTEEEVYETANGGPGTDIYYKGAWVLHTLRWLIGDAAFADATRLLVYGRTDPRPGNFHPRYVRTADFVAAAERTAGRPLGWFFDAYLRRAALPDLVTARDGDRLTLEWRADGAFPMPVEIAVDGAVRRIDLTAGRATVPVAAGAHVVIDPMARILRRSPAVERMQAWQARRSGAAVTRSGGP